MMYMIYASILQFVFQAFWHGLFLAQYPRFNTNRLEKQHVGCFQCFKVSNHGRVRSNSFFVSRCFTLAWYINFGMTWTIQFFTHGYGASFPAFCEYMSLVSWALILGWHFAVGDEWVLLTWIKFQATRRMASYCSHPLNCNVDFCKKWPSQVLSPKAAHWNREKHTYRPFENPQQKNKSDPLNSRHPESSQDLFQSIMFDLPKMRRKKKGTFETSVIRQVDLYIQVILEMRPQKHESNLETSKEVIL